MIFGLSAFVILKSSWLFILGMVNAGLGPTQVDTFLTAMNLPELNTKTLREGQKEISVGVIGNKMFIFIY